MSALKDALEKAAGQGLIAQFQVEGLAAWLMAQGFGKIEHGPVAQAAANSGFFADLSSPRDAEPVQAVEESESPRFVRGFHDILITIGIVVALSGLGGLATAFAVLPAIVVLSEILVKRQRLALPAVVLTVALGMATYSCAFHLLGNPLVHSNSSIWLLLAMLACFPVVFLPYYWRYRVPLALAGLIYFALATLALLIFNGLSSLTGPAGPLDDDRPMVLIVFLAFALGVFALAMTFDMRDPARKTRASDVAFWLHLTAAPALLYAVLAMIFLRRGSPLWFVNPHASGDAAIVVLVVVVFMLVGVIIDRRAFVTSGLLSLAVAIGVMIRHSELSMKASSVFLPLLLVGITVLSVGVGWRPLRRGVVSALPQTLRQRLPPI